MSEHIGQQLGNYRIVRLLGQGGFAKVYLGEHIHLNTEAAIKVLSASLENQDVEIFRTEAQVIARLKHPHIVRVLDFGIDKAVPFLVMDYAPNGPLSKRHPRGTRVPLTTIVLYVQQIADALDYLHQQRFIHRDIKPQNILLGSQDEILLSDFGIATLVQSSLHQSLKSLAGTMAYMAPEQIQGTPRRASDQYALGIMVYEWLVGRRPFQGSYKEVASQHLLALPPSPRKFNPDIDPEIDEIVLRTLAKEPSQRFANVKEFAKALKQAVEKIVSSQKIQLDTASNTISPVIKENEIANSKNSLPDTRATHSSPPEALLPSDSDLNNNTKSSALPSKLLPPHPLPLSQEMANPAPRSPQSPTPEPAFYPDPHRHVLSAPIGQQSLNRQVLTPPRRVTPSKPAILQQRSKKKSQKLVGIFIAPILLLSIVATLFYFGPRAIVTIQTLTNAFFATGNSTATGTTSSDNTKAQGWVEFTNHGNQDLIIPNNTIIQTPDGIQFVTNAEFYISAQSVFPGVPITALRPGDKGNVGAGTITVIPTSSLTSIARRANISPTAINANTLTVTNTQATTGRKGN